MKRSRALSRILILSVLLGGAAYVYTKFAPVVRDELQSLQPFPTQVNDLAYEAEDIRFETADGLSLAGSYVPSRNGATIILLHGYRGSRLQVQELARALIASGFGILSYDTRAHGESEGTVIGYGREEVKDLNAALDWLEAHSKEGRFGRIGAYGFSMGGFILARQAAHDTRIDSLVLASTPHSATSLAKDSDGGGVRGFISGHIRLLTDEILGVSAWGLGILETIRYISPRPILLIGGSEDEPVPEKRLREIFAAAEMPKSLLVFPGAGHGDYMEKDKERFESAVLAHFQETLLRSRSAQNP